MAAMKDSNVFTDLSGISDSSSSNPYDGLLNACRDDPVCDYSRLTVSVCVSNLWKHEVQMRYQTHRQTRNEQQKQKLLSSEFEGFNIDQTLAKLLDAPGHPGFVDPRNCLVFWARPSLHLRNLIGEVQTQLRALAPSKHIV